MSTVIAYDFIQPVPGLTTVVPILDPTGFIAGASTDIFGIATYVVARVSPSESALPSLTLLNPFPSPPLTVPPGTVIVGGSTITP